MRLTNPYTGKPMGSVSCSQPDFLHTFAKIATEQRDRAEKYMKMVKGFGCKASLPDDGWVNREANYCQFVNPHFGDDKTIQEGDLIAFEKWDGSWRIHRVTRIEAYGCLDIIRVRYSPEPVMVGRTKEEEK